MSPRIDFEFKEIYQKHTKGQTKSYFQEPRELENLVNMGKLVQIFLLKQSDIDKILKK